MQVTDIISGPVKVYYAPIGTTLPADSLAFGAAWPAGWVNWGSTKEPLKMIYEGTPLEIMVEEALASVDRRIQAEKGTLECVLAELTATNLNLAAGGQLVTTAAGSGQVGKEDWYVGGNARLIKRMFAFEGDYYDEDDAHFPIRLFVWRATCVPHAELSFSKKEQLGLAVKVDALADLTKPINQQLWQFQKILEPGT